MMGFRFPHYTSPKGMRKDKTTEKANVFCLESLNAKSTDKSTFLPHRIGLLMGLTLKITFIIAITFTKRVSKLQALLMEDPRLIFIFLPR